jgi:hypothetical protein
MLIRRRFPEAKFPPEASPVRDFETIRHARHVALSVSTFSWLAAWLSETVATIHMPICGLFDPLANTAMLVPVDDARFTFYRVPFPRPEQRRNLDLDAWLEGEHAVTALDRRDVARRVLHSLYGNVRVDGGLLPAGGQQAAATMARMERFR